MIRVFSHYLPLNYMLLVALEALVLLLSIVVGVSLTFPEAHLTLSRNAGSLWQSAMVFVGVMLILMAALGLYRNESNMAEGMKAMLLKLAVSFLLGLAIMSVIFSLEPNLFVARGAFGLAFLSALCGIVVTRVAFAKVNTLNLLAPRILVLGSGSRALQMETAYRAGPHRQRPNIVGYLRLPSEPETSHPRVLRDEGSILDIVQKHRVNEVVVAVRDRRGGALPVNELLECKLRGIRITELATFFERECGQVRLDSLNPSWIILNEGFNNTSMRDLVKRVFDVVASTGLLIAALPLMLVTAVAIKLESAGPVFYRQERVGKDGKSFNVLKFRSMTTDAEKNGPQWASANDSRVTCVGAVIRKLRIDEIPQIFNVFRGDMSFVGPRPERPVFVEQLAREIPYFNARHSIKPGITGWAQVCYPYGASAEDSVQKLQYDLYYLKNHSLFLDLMVLLDTVQVVLTGRGAR